MMVSFMMLCVSLIGTEAHRNKVLVALDDIHQVCDPATPEESVTSDVFVQAAFAGLSEMCDIDAGSSSFSGPCDLVCQLQRIYDSISHVNIEKAAVYLPEISKRVANARVRQERYAELIPNLKKDLWKAQQILEQNWWGAHHRVRAILARSADDVEPLDSEYAKTLRDGTLSFAELEPNEEWTFPGLEFALPEQGNRLLHRYQTVIESLLPLKEWFTSMTTRSVMCGDNETIALVNHDIAEKLLDAMRSLNSNSEANFAAPREEPAKRTPEISGTGTVFKIAQMFGGSALGNSRPKAASRASEMALPEFWFSAHHTVSHECELLHPNKPEVCLKKFNLADARSYHGAMNYAASAITIIGADIGKKLPNKCVGLA